MPGPSRNLTLASDKKAIGEVRRGGMFMKIGAVRMLAVLVAQETETAWSLKENLVQRGMLGVGILMLFILGIFPQAVGPIVEKLPLMFQHLNR